MGKKREAVNHPKHYGGDVTHETWKCLEAWGLPNDAYLWNAAKYISRAGKKGDFVEDLKKAAWYLQKAIDKRAGNLETFVKGVNMEQRPLSRETLQRIHRILCERFGTSKMFPFGMWVKLFKVGERHASR